MTYAICDEETGKVYYGDAMEIPDTHLTPLVNMGMTPKSPEQLIYEFLGTPLKGSKSLDQFEKATNVKNRDDVRIFLNNKWQKPHRSYGCLYWKPIENK